MKAFWVTWARVIPYDKKMHFYQLWNFLYWTDGGDGEELLIAGDGDYFDIENDGIGSHKNLRHCFCHHAFMAPTTPPDGAGRGSWGTNELSWESVGFQVKTPEDLRPRIIAALMP
jgi:hypothetical protein